MGGGESITDIYRVQRKHIHLDHSAEISLSWTKSFCKDIIKDKVRKGRLDPENVVS